jgi:metallo-beta-lactamase class B
MKSFVNVLLVIIFCIGNVQCSAQKQASFKPKELYRTKELIITQISSNAFQHISFLQTDDFGNVPCNGLIVRGKNEVIVFDTPTNDSSTNELINWISEKLHCKINAIIPTHFHNDCLGGLKAFENHGTPSYANVKTIDLAMENNFVVPKNSFTDSLVLTVGGEKVIVKFFGEGHTKDNVIGYFPREQVMFGGCLIKELKAGKGFLGDANIAEWSATVEKIKAAYPDLKIVVPGHGQYGDSKLLDYTISLFKVK